MKRFRVSIDARRDLQEIWKYIARESEAAADRLYEKLYQTFAALAQNPRIGRRREELRRDLRSFPAGEYVIFYGVVPGGVRIVRVIHGHRDLPSIFR